LEQPDGRTGIEERRRRQEARLGNGPVFGGTLVPSKLPRQRPQPVNLPNFD